MASSKYLWPALTAVARATWDHWSFMVLRESSGYNQWNKCQGRNKPGTKGSRVKRCLVDTTTSRSYSKLLCLLFEWSKSRYFSCMHRVAWIVAMVLSGPPERAIEANIYHATFAIHCDSQELCFRPALLTVVTASADAYFLFSAIPSSHRPVHDHWAASSGSRSPSRATSGVPSHV